MSHKVYISSTYSDLKAHRQEVIEFFEKKTIKEIFDLTSMEGYVADNNPPALECIRDVQLCDIYILIIANRYGFIPPDAAMDPDRISITEMEYNAAVTNKKIILAFFADERDSQFVYDSDADPALAAEKKQKLAAFKTRVRETRLTHPEPFISSFHLALQIAESLMRSSYISFKLDDTRKYCCDRVPQFTQYLQMPARTRFHAVAIYGSSSELGINLINRFGIFSLSINSTDIYPLFNFEDILISENYAQCRTGLLINIYYRLFNNTNIEDKSVASFLTTFNSSNKPLVLVINCDVEFFEENQQNFLINFMEELYAEGIKQPGRPIYLFLNFQENGVQPVADEMVKKLQSVLPNQEKYLSVLPRLKPLSLDPIRNWLFTYVSPDEGRVEDIMDIGFNNLPTPLSMRVADREIREFIKKVNNKDEKILKIITP